MPQTDFTEIEIARLRAALEEVRAVCAMPLPDPNTHSWLAFHDATFTRLAHCAQIAERSLLSTRYADGADETKQIKGRKR